MDEGHLTENNDPNQTFEFVTISCWVENNAYQDTDQSYEREHTK